MLQCPKCSEIYFDDSISICSNCGIPISEVDSLNLSNFPWALIYTTGNELIAEMLKHNLESADIPVNILSQRDSSRQLNVGALAVIKIYVPSPLHSIAMEFIKSIDDSANNIIDIT